MRRGCVRWRRRTCRCLGRRTLGMGQEQRWAWRSSWSRVKDQDTRNESWMGAGSRPVCASNTKASLLTYTEVFPVRDPQRWLCPSFMTPPRKCGSRLMLQASELSSTRLTLDEEEDKIMMVDSVGLCRQAPVVGPVLRCRRVANF